MIFIKAIVRHRYGPPEVLSIAELPAPVPKHNEVLVRVHATTVSRTDCGILRGIPYAIRLFSGLRRPRIIVTGTDFAGVVESVGTSVTVFKPGERVWGFNDEGLGTHAQFVTIREDKGILHMPEHFSFEQAAASAEGAHYAFNTINKLKLQRGNKAMVNGATGAIGSALVQLLKAEGLYITAVGDTKNLDRMQALGPDRVIDRMTTDFTQDNEIYDFVFDSVGKSSFGACKRLLTKHGIYISSELGPNWENVWRPLFNWTHSGKKILFPLPQNIRRSMLHIKQLADDGKFKPMIDRTYSPTQMADAFRYTMSGQKLGNVIVDFSKF